MVRRLAASMALAVALGGWTAPLTAAPRLPLSETAYRHEIERWRADREASLRAPDGWLSVAGLFFLKEGRNTFGSDRANDVVLPPSAPAQAGWFDFRDGRVFAHINGGVTATVKGGPVRDVELVNTTDLGRNDALQIGQLALFVHLSGDRVAIRVRDANSQIRRRFRGTKWFPVDTTYRVTARFTPLAVPKPVEVPNVLGDAEHYVIAGVLTFALHGQEYALQPFGVPGGKDDAFFIVFRDLTSGHGTYAAARFLDAEFPKNGETVIDFNKAYNPPCAFNPHTTCPLPLPQNRLGVRIEAGEKDYGEHGGPSR